MKNTAKLPDINLYIATKFWKTLNEMQLKNHIKYKTIFTGFFKPYQYKKCFKVN